MEAILILPLMLIFGIFVRLYRSNNKVIASDDKETPFSKEEIAILEERIWRRSITQLPVVHASEARYLRNLNQELYRRGGPLGEGSANGDIDNGYMPFLKKKLHLRSIKR